MIIKTLTKELKLELKTILSNPKILDNVYDKLKYNSTGIFLLESGDLTLDDLFTSYDIINNIEIKVFTQNVIRNVSNELQNIIENENKSEVKQVSVLSKTYEYLDLLHKYIKLKYNKTCYLQCLNYIYTFYENDYEISLPETKKNVKLMDFDKFRELYYIPLTIKTQFVKQQESKARDFTVVKKDHELFEYFTLVERISKDEEIIKQQEEIDVCEELTRYNAYDYCVLVKNTEDLKYIRENIKDNLYGVKIKDNPIYLRFCYDKFIGYSIISSFYKNEKEKWEKIPIVSIYSFKDNVVNGEFRIFKTFKSDIAFNILKKKMDSLKYLTNYITTCHLLEKDVHLSYYDYNILKDSTYTYVKEQIKVSEYNKGDLCWVDIEGNIELRYATGTINFHNNEEFYEKQKDHGSIFTKKDKDAKTFASSKHKLANDIEIPQL
jgi:hypothetical protein